MEPRPDCQMLLTDLVTHDTSGYQWEAIVNCSGSCNYGEDNGMHMRTERPFDGSSSEVKRTLDILNKNAIAAARKSHCPFFAKGTNT